MSTASVANVAAPTATAPKILYGSAIFLSALLLFQAQLLMGKFLLPWFGGTSAVWTTCMLFYQSILLLGYAYAHGVASRLTRKQQGELHVALLTAAVLIMAWNAYSWGSPLLPDVSWRPAANTPPVLHIMLLLSMSVGIPLFLLSCTSPLFQSWYGREDSRPPYFLYALSNTGSLLALLSYPALVEPFLRVRVQALMWSAGFVGFGLLCAWCAFRFKALDEQPIISAIAEATTAPARSRVGLWFALSAWGSFLLLAVTNLLTQDVSPIPLLWVLPLCVYLLTFIIAFEHERWYKRAVFQPLLLVTIGVAIFARQPEIEWPVKWMVLIFLGFLFAACMICHGELARMKPEKTHLTLFYLVIALGGACGGLLVSVVAPLIFKTNIEFAVGQIGVLAIVLVLLAFEPGSWVRTSRWKPAVAGVVVIAVGYVALMERVLAGDTILARSRNFYGALRVVDSVSGTFKGQPMHYRWLMHGRISHGTQLAMPEVEQLPTAYYAPNSGVALAIATQAHGRDGIRVGLVGLGIGTLAAYGRPGDYYRFYEINPQVFDYAAGEGGYFSFLRHSPSKADAVIGDARSSMEAELKKGDRQGFDVIVLDAFNGDAIPMHLLTREAMQLYRSHLRGPDSIIAVHISNKYVDLEPVVSALAKDGGFHVVMVRSGPHPYLSLGSQWALLSAGDGLRAEAILKTSQPIRDTVKGKPIPVWTDDYSNLFSLMLAGKP